MFLGGSIVAPFRLQFSPFVIASSGRPYNIVTGFDNNLDGIRNDRPGLVRGPGTGIIATPYGFLDPNPKPGEQLVPRNAGDGPTMFMVNLTLTRTWGFGTTKFAGVVGGARAHGGGAVTWMEAVAPSYGAPLQSDALRQRPELTESRKLQHTGRRPHIALFPAGDRDCGRIWC